MDSVFEFDSYVAFLRSRLQKTGPSRGLRSKLAEHLGVKGSFVSQVLGGKLNLSLEQAIQVAEFLSLKEVETEFFLLLVNEARAGSKRLQDFYAGRIAKIRAYRAEMISRVKSDERVSDQDRLQYFSSWQYCALHVLLTIPGYQDPKAMAKRLGIPVKSVSEKLTFLEKIGIAEKNGDRWQVGKTRFHIDSNSPYIERHHLNWRERSFIPIGSDNKSGQHYTCVMSLSLKDAEKVRALWLKFLETLTPVIVQSPEEELYALHWDFYQA